MTKILYHDMSNFKDIYNNIVNFALNKVFMIPTFLLSLKFHNSCHQCF